MPQKQLFQFKHSPCWEFGYRDGRRLGTHLSNREIAEMHPDWSDDSITRYQNGRDEGVAEQQAS